MSSCKEVREANDGNRWSPVRISFSFAWVVGDTAEACAFRVEIPVFRGAYSYVDLPFSDEVSESLEPFQLGIIQVLDVILDFFLELFSEGLASVDFGGRFCVCLSPHENTEWCVAEVLGVTEIGEVVFEEVEAGER